MELLGGLIRHTIRNVASPLIDEVSKHIVRQVKDSGVIESTIDDIAYTVTKDSKYAKIMKCKFCGNEYDNTLQTCPSCGAPNENRKFDYQKDNNESTIQHLLNIGDVVSDGQLTMYIIDIKDDKYITTLSKDGTIKTPQKISDVDGAIQDGSFKKI